MSNDQQEQTADGDYQENQPREKGGTHVSTTKSDVDVPDNPPDSPGAASERVAQSSAAPGSGGNPEDDDFVSWKDVTYERDSDGELKAATPYVEELGGNAKAYPMTDQQRKIHVEDLLDQDSDKEEITDAELADLFDRNLVEPDLTEHPECPDDRVTEHFVSENMSQYFQDACWMSVLLASDEYEIVRLLRRDLRDGEIDTLVKTQLAREEQENQEQGPTASGRGNRRGKPR